MAKKKTFLVLDGNALLHRAWHAIPPLTAPDGRVVNAAYGFTNVIEKMRTEMKPDYMAVAWDLPGGTFRHEKFKEYKGTRKKKEPELYAQIDFIKDILAEYNIPSLSVKGMEADDICGTLAKTYGPDAKVHVNILTGDLDALQLVDKNVNVVVFIKGLSETKVYDIDAVKERYGLTPDQLIDLKALMGDSSDNIPGLAGVGQKTATSLLEEFGSIEKIYDAIEADKVPEKYAKKFRGQEETVTLMKELVTIVEDVPLKGFTVKDAEVEEPNVEKLTDLFRDFGFRRLLSLYSDEAPEEKPAKKASSKKVVAAKSLKDLTGSTRVVAIDAGQQDLFGGAIRSLTIFDGKKAYTVESPSETMVTEVIDDLNAAKLVIGHDLKDAMHLMDHISAPVFDTMVAAYLLAPGSRAFDFETSVFEHLSKKVGADIATDQKAKLTFELHKVLSAGLKKEGMEKLAEEIEMPLIAVLHKMEDAGIEVDQKKLKDLSKQFGGELERLTKKIYKLAGKEFNINSPAQLADVLFVDLELPSKKIKKTKTGYSTAASELEKLWETHEIVPLISEYREFAKLKSTYVDALPLLVQKDGRIHSSFNQTVAATGRLSSSDPNLQNIPIRTKLGNEIRKAFVAPRGKTLIAADYSQFELRLTASFAKDEGFLKAFNEGADIHTRTASEVLNKPEAEITKEERSAAKAINFGIIYGMGARNLARSTGFSQAEAKEFIQRYFDVHPGVQNYIETAKALAHKKGYAETLFGRKRYLPDINGNVPMLIASAERMAVNMPIQGTQADLVKVAMIDMADWIENTDLDITMLLQVHDELVFEVANADLDAAAEKVKEIMEAAWKSDVPLVVDVEVGKSWGELRPWEQRKNH